MTLILKTTRRLQRAATKLHVAALLRAMDIKDRAAQVLTTEARDLYLCAREARQHAEHFETAVALEAERMGVSL